MCLMCVYTPSSIFATITAKNLMIAYSSVLSLFDQLPRHLAEEIPFLSLFQRDNSYLVLLLPVLQITALVFCITVCVVFDFRFFEHIANR